MISGTSQTICQQCGQPNARQYERFLFSQIGEAPEIEQHLLCVKCVHQLRAQGVAAVLPDSSAITREELIAELDQFWAESGAGEICRQCHEQGTGCCPPMCRHLGTTGCLQKNVFCTGFVCSALLNGIAECDTETAKRLKWVKRIAAAEFRIYEMVTRVAAIDREPARPLIVPASYPDPLQLKGEALKPKLFQLADEILEIRRRWHQEELSQIQDIKAR